MGLLARTLDVCKKEQDRYGFEVHYALKANSRKELLELIRDRGFGADCVSGNEVQRAIDTGFASNKIAFAGVGKSDAEILTALRYDIFCFNVESIPELQVISELAAAQNKTARIALRLNPNVNAHTHHYITTGLEENKFGINAWELPEVLEVLKALPNVELIGLHFHIGSQITDLEVFKNLCTRVNEFQNWFSGRGYDLPHVNVGGGLGVHYQQPDAHSIPDFAAYFRLFDQYLERRAGQQVHFELGRALVAHCGSLISRVLYIKKGIKTNFLILDAGMTELMRPALYQAYHKIEKMFLKDSERNIQSGHPTILYDVVGPICESSDCFGKAVSLPEMQRGDLVRIRSTGAYGEVMSSNYNLRELNEVLFV